MIRVAGTFGLSLSQLLEMTPAELELYVEELNRAKNDTIIISSWLTAAFSRAKKLPDAEKFLSKPKRTIDPKQLKQDYEELKKQFGVV